MFIKKVLLFDAKSDLSISEINFDKLNILVGTSGAGKTTIMIALFSVIKIAQGQSYPLTRWEMEFIDNDGRNVSWHGRFSITAEHQADELIEEKLIIEGKTVISKVAGKTTYNGTTLPVMDKKLSNIFLLREDDTIKPIYDSMASIILVYNNSSLHTETVKVSVISEALLDKAQVFFENNKTASINDLHRQDPTVNCWEKLYLAHRFDQASFENFNFLYTSIFDNVKTIAPKMTPMLAKEGSSIYQHALYFSLILNDGTQIEQHEISSGMFKTMMLLAELLLSSKNTVLLIDEVENSLGINCLPDVIEEIKSTVLQCVVSTHHPKIINDIPAKNWKIINRKGNQIHADDASDIAASTSHHDPFIQLINSNSYKNGNA